MSSAPVARGSLLGGSLTGLKRSPIDELTAAWRASGDVVRLRLGPPGVGRVGHLIVHPEHVEHVLVRNAGNYQLSAGYEVLREFLGDGLLTSHGEGWKRHRRLAQPAFSAGRLAAVAPMFVQAAEAASHRLLAGDGTPVDLAAEMARLTLDGVGRALFGAQIVHEAAVVAPALRTIQDSTLQGVYSPLTPSIRRQVRRLPTPGTRRHRAAVRDLDRVVERLVTDRRRHPGPADDLLGLLMVAHEGSAPGDRAVRDEVMTFLLAGHETTASALTWTLALLSRHPQVRERLHAELDRVLAGRPVCQGDLPDLPLLAAVLNESLRLFPPAWTLERQAQEADTIGGFDIPAGSTIVLAPYLTHRHPDFWENPEGFDPDRWLVPTARPRCAYLPFGAGARQCIGGSFAILEASVMLATLLQSTQADLMPGELLRPTPRITLTAGSGIAVRVSPRGRPSRGTDLVAALVPAQAVAGPST